MKFYLAALVYLAGFLLRILKDYYTVSYIAKQKTEPLATEVGMALVHLTFVFKRLCIRSVMHAW